MRYRWNIVFSSMRVRHGPAWIDEFWMWAWVLWAIVPLWTTIDCPFCWKSPYATHETFQTNWRNPWYDSCDAHATRPPWMVPSFDENRVSNMWYLETANHDGWQTNVVHLALRVFLCRRRHDFFSMPYPCVYPFFVVKINKPTLLWINQNKKKIENRNRMQYCVVAHLSASNLQIVTLRSLLLSSRFFLLSIERLTDMKSALWAFSLILCYAPFIPSFWMKTYFYLFAMEWIRANPL